MNADAGTTTKVTTTTTEVEVASREATTGAEPSVAPDAGGAPADAESAATGKGPSWQQRHPRVSRGILYGCLAAVVAVAWVLLAQRAKAIEEDRQRSLVTRLQGVSELIRSLAPEDALRVVRDEILAKSPNDDVRLQARLEEAAILDQLQRWDEAEKAYDAIERGWPHGRPKGALFMPWATMRVREGRVDEALALLQRPGATEGFTDDEVAVLREHARKRAEQDRARGGASVK